MNSQFLGLPSFVWIAALAIIIVVVWFRKPKKAEFKKLSAEQEIRKKYKELMDTMGSEKIKKKMNYGFEHKGYVGRSFVKNWKEIAENKENIEVLCFEIYKKKIGGWIKMQLGAKPFTYWIAPKTAITENYKEIAVDPTYHYDNVMGVIVFSKVARNVLEDESYKINHEQSINEMINWLGLQSYLSVQHAQSSESLDHIADIEKTKKEDMISEMTGKKKK